MTGVAVLTWVTWTSAMVVDAGDGVTVLIAGFRCSWCLAGNLGSGYRLATDPGTAREVAGVDEIKSDWFMVFRKADSGNTCP